ncbi:MULTISPECIES: hypothetical protein [unclassified Breznakia]|uniref:hypothetical protein n=1 Tax=unclassified Breznakia TaxID=2623764 RepID=UPI0024752A00|nr:MULTISPECIES: hypothetical protein [unclassified Breznakia]MDH6367160.1 hypothetical protein [Breznakia sp. PH1-1]MDH6404253.1 hypothetical protein [Breznakia sp. PF1-11]MDH6412048.1 hypothetical protein [Breznakia sp. PFB1-11]MDH6414241.1 hypothetical protein [Breznakia sp. PFB1-14]MDH6416662.1 hypothetical protein [Breznakia sp. PFB1-4]
MKKYTLKEIKENHIGILIRNGKELEKVANMFVGENWRNGDALKNEHYTKDTPFVMAYTKSFKWQLLPCRDLGLNDDLLRKPLSKIIIQVGLIKE